MSETLPNPCTVCGAPSAVHVPGGLFCLQSQLAAATKRADEAERKDREREDEIAQLHGVRQSLSGELAGCRDLIAKLRTRIAELEGHVHFCPNCKMYCKECECVEAKIFAAAKEIARLRDGIQATINYVRSGVHCRTIDHTTGFCDCEEICGEFAALLAKPEGAK